LEEWVTELNKVSSASSAGQCDCEVGLFLLLAN